MQLRYSRLIVRSLLSHLILSGVVLISACTAFEPTLTSIPSPPAIQADPTISATTELQPSLPTTSTIDILVAATATLAVNSSAKHIPTRALILYSDGQGVYSYPEHFAFSHAEVQTLYASVKLTEHLPRYLIKFGPQLSSSGDTMLIPAPNSAKDDKTWLLSLTDGTLRQAVDKSVVTVWKPQGAQFAYLQDGSLYIQDILPLDRESHLLLKTEKELGFVSWSPDGNWLLSVERTGNDNDYNFWLVSATDKITRLLGAFPLPTTELSTDVIFQWNPTSDLVWINTSNGSIFLTLKGEIVGETSLLGLEWVFCNIQRLPIKCIKKIGIDELNGYTRIAPTWVLCQQNFWNLSHNCKQRVVFYQNKLYVNNLISGELQEVATIDRDINSIKWTPNDEYLIFDTLPLLPPLQHTENQGGEIYSLSLVANEIALLPIHGILLDIISTPK